MFVSSENKRELLFFTLLAISTLLFLYSRFMSIAELNSGVFVYNHDDAYIHLDIAKNFAENGIWGVNDGEFSSSSSSLGWTILLASFFKFFGTSESVPLLLNMVLAVLFVLFLFKIFRLWQISEIPAALGALAIWFAAPTDFLVFSGLEHLLHIVLTLLFIFYWCEKLKDVKRDQNYIELKGVILTALLPMSRFEGLFAVAAVILILIFMKQWRAGAILMFAASAPILIYGIISLGNGWFILPNSVYLKGSSPDLSPVGFILFLYEGVKQFVYNIHLLAGMAGVTALLIYIRKDKVKPALEISGVIIILTTAMHLLFAKSGYFSRMLFRTRYDSYLTVIVLFFIIAAISLLLNGKKMLKKDLAAYALLLVILFLPFFERSVIISGKTARASVNVYMQQYQMGLFLNKFYKGESVAVNDIGLTGYIGDIYVVDLLGLANRDIGESFKNGTYSSSEVEKIVDLNKCNIVVVFDKLFQFAGSKDKLPEKWIKAGEWRIPSNVICASDTVSFYAVNRESFGKLADSLRVFSKDLPKGVIWRVKETVSTGVENAE